MMISEVMNTELNNQITAEFDAAHGYLAMACALDQMGLKILAKLFHAQHHEEREHAMKILGYIQNVGGKVVMTEVNAPKVEYSHVEAVVQAALDSELHITQTINDLVDLAVKEKDHATRSFLNRFVDEQVEEVAGMTGLLALVKLAGDNMLQVESRVRHEMLSKS